MASGVWMTNRELLEAVGWAPEPSTRWQLLLLLRVFFWLEHRRPA